MVNAKFEPNCPEKIFERGKKWLVDTEKNFSGTANYCVFSQKGQVEPHLGAACHYNIQHPRYSDRCLVATSNGRKLNAWGLTAEDSEPFLRWLLHDSYMGQFILNRDDFEFCRDHGFIVSADVYTPLLQNIMITTRHFKEISPFAFKKFGELVAMGLDGSIAYLLCMCSNISYYNSDQPQQVLTSKVGHRALWILPTIEQVGKLVRGDLPEVVNDPKLHYRLNNNYRGGVTIFGDEGHGDYFHKQLLKRPDRILANALAKHRGQGEAEAYRPPNPFDLAPTNLDPTAITNKETWEVLVPYLIEHKPWLSEKETS